MIIPVELLFYYFSNVVCVEILICRKQKGCLQLLLENAWLYTCRHDRMIVGFITNYAISAYHHCRCEFESRSGEVYSIQYYVIVGTPVSSTNKTDRHDIIEILL
jgi:hypothetical protein